MKKIILIITILASLTARPQGAYTQIWSQGDKNHSLDTCVFINNTEKFESINREFHNLSISKKNNFTFPITQPYNEKSSGSLSIFYDSIYKWSWDSSKNSWETKPFNRTIDILYDKNNNKLSELNQILRPHPDQWIDNMKYTYTYDSSNNLKSELIQKWNRTYNTWDLYYSTTFSYDSKNNRTGMITEHWNGTSLESSYQYISTFDDNNNEITYLAQRLEGSWTDLYKYFFEYDENNNRISLIFKKYGNTSSVDSCKSYSFYDSNNNMLKELFLWKINNEWVNYEQHLFTYSNNNMLSILVQKWDNNLWSDLARNLYTYDLNNNQTSEISQDWVGGNWRNNLKYKHTFNNDNNKNSTTFHWYNNDGISYYSGDSTYYYSHMSSYDINKQETQTISIYPNPATDFVSFINDNVNNEIVEFRIYSVMGVLVRSEILEQFNHQINVKDLSNGTYFITIRLKKLKYNQKLIIQRP